jgi:hypothetical protein
VDIDDGKKERVNIFHKHNTFILVSLDVLDTRSDQDNKNVLKFKTSIAVMREEVIFVISGRNGVPTAS